MLSVPLSDAIKLEESVSASSPLLQVGGRAIHLMSGPSQVARTPRPDSAVPEVDIRFTRTMWEMTTTGIGLAAGSALRVSVSP